MPRFRNFTTLFPVIGAVTMGLLGLVIAMAMPSSSGMTAYVATLGLFAAAFLGCMMAPGVFVKLGCALFMMSILGTAYPLVTVAIIVLLGAAMMFAPFFAAASSPIMLQLAQQRR